MEDFDRHPNLELPALPQKGRGAAGNVDHRYSNVTRTVEDDGWEREAAVSPRTRLLTDTAHSVISHNQSPDLGFDQSINPYRGCEHGCIYCYARPTHAWLGLSPGLDFETQIFHKPDAPGLLREELARLGYRCSPIALGTATDAYQPLERQLKITRSILEVLLETQHPVTVVTKSTNITRDVDLWAQLAALNLAHVAISLTTLDGTLARNMEPRASAPHARLRAIAALAEAGVPVTVLVAPLIPALTDHELEPILSAAKDHGASSAGYTLLRLPHEVAGLFKDWLAHHAPEKANRLMSVLYDMRGGRTNDSRFGSRMKGLGHYADLIRQRFDLACRRLELTQEPAVLDCGKFAPPAPPREGQVQLSLF